MIGNEKAEYRVWSGDSVLATVPIPDNETSVAFINEGAESVRVTKVTVMVPGFPEHHLARGATPLTLLPGQSLNMFAPHIVLGWKSEEVAA